MVLNEKIPGDMPGACNTFSSDFYKAFSSHNTGNIITSPISTHIILSLLSYGSSGTTLDELKGSLYLQDLESMREEFTSFVSAFNEIKAVDLSIKNAIYVQEDFEFLTEFSSLSTQIFKCAIAKTNFENKIRAAQQINDWVRESTKDKISGIVSADDFDATTKVVLLNAVYFKGHWLDRFDPHFTQNREFYVTKEETKFVQTMFKKSKFYHGIIPDLNATFLEIPYTNKDLVMVIILPDEVDGLSDLEQNFHWQELTTQARQKKDFELYLPKFKFDVTANLETVLRKIGVQSIFEDTADFSSISDTALKVSNVFQKVFIEVNEEGSEAAAVTGVQMRLKRAANISEEYHVNRPFMFAIQYKPKNSPLFIGSVRNIGSLTQRDEL